MRLRTKIILLAVLPLVASLLLIALAIGYQERSLARREQVLVAEAYMDARRAELRHYVELASSTIRPLYETGRNDPGRRAEALKLLESLYYGEDGYFFVYDLHGKVLMHSRQPELEGRDLWELRDPRGRATIQDLIKVARTGGGYVDYLWRKPSSGQVVSKLGYVIALEDWDWMLGTGLYLDDIEATMRQFDREVRNNVATTLLWIAGIAALGVALISISGLLLNLSEQRVADAKLRLLAMQVVQSQEDERARLARELHDGTSQTLVSTKLLIESAVADMQRGSPAPTGVLHKALARLNDTLVEVRDISHRLRPALLDTLGLPAALQHLGGEFEEVARLEVGVSILGHPAELPEVAKTVLFRLAQEALTNIAKHAAASRVEIALEFRPDGGVGLRVSDNGQGFDIDAVNLDPRRGIGLRNMRERLASIGGDIEIESRPGFGTRIEARVPSVALRKLEAR